MVYRCAGREKTRPVKPFRSLQNGPLQIISGGQSKRLQLASTVIVWESHRGELVASNLAWPKQQHTFAAAEYARHTPGHQRR